MRFHLSKRKLVSSLKLSKLIEYKVKLKNSLIWWNVGRKVKKDILHAYKHLPKDHISNDINVPLDYLKRNRIKMLCYSFPNNYDSKKIDVYRDDVSKLPYVLHKGKRLFFKRSWKKRKVQEYYNYLLVEQDLESPHRYLSSDFNVQNGDTIIDAGAAEGILSLDLIEDISFCHIFEPDNEWIEALEQTFRPWNNKVKIYPLYLGKTVSESSITLDKLFSHKDNIGFIKVDVEGYECDLVHGATNLLNESTNIKVAICTYHRQQDEAELSRMFHNLDFQFSFSDGYILLYFDQDIEFPYFRRGLLRASK